MKRIISIILALITCLSLTACSEDARAFKNGKKAFDSVTKAYVATNEFSSDIYEAWFCGVNNKSKYDDNSEMDDFAAQMNIESKYIEQATATLLGKDKFEYSDWTKLPSRFNYSHFSAWVQVISKAYECKGEVDNIKYELTKAMSAMKTMSGKHSDYEHYPSLKKYFTNTLAFFDFCCNPEGTFQQVVDTFNNYRNTAREYFFDLHYVFGESIGGIDDFIANLEDESSIEDIVVFVEDESSIESKSVAFVEDMTT